MKKTCKCGSEFEAPDAVAKWMQNCPSCSDVAIAASTAAWIKRKADDRRLKWTEICPPAFICTERNKLPIPEMFDRVMQWNGGDKGLLLHGATGTGKSRCAWAVLRREFMSGRGVYVLTASSGADYAASFEFGASYAARWLKRAIKAEILLCDDVFKTKATESWESALFSVINARCDWNRPMIFTLNDTGETLLQRLSVDRGQPMLRRIRENCQSIGFVKK